MAVIILTPGQIALVDPNKADVKAFIAGGPITAGQAVYMDTTTGNALVADANAPGAQQCRGIALNPAVAGQAVAVLRRGEVYGYTLTNQDYDDPVYLSDTEGALDDATGTLTVIVGRVCGLTDAARTKVIFIDAQWARVWA